MPPRKKSPASDPLPRPSNELANGPPSVFALQQDKEEEGRLGAEALPSPVVRMAHIAATADPAALRGYQPSSSVRTLAGTLLECEPVSFVDLADKSGMSPAQVYTILRDPTAVAWIMQESTRIAKGALSAIYARMYKMAMTAKNSSWAELFLKRFDPEFKEDGGASLTLKDGAKSVTFENWTTAELQAYLRQKRQLVLGESDANGSAASSA